MSPADIIKEIKSGKISPIYLLFGEEKYIIEDSLKQITELIVDPSAEDFNLNRYDASVHSVVEVLDSARTLPFMSDRRIIIVKGIKPKARKEEGEEEEEGKEESFIDSLYLINYLESPYKESCIIFVSHEAKMDQRKKFYKNIQKNGKILNCQKLNLKGAVAWLKKRTESKGFKIDYTAAEELAETCNNNLKRIESELEKIFLYSGKDRVINSDTVCTVAGNNKIDSIFDLTKTIGNKDLKLSLDKMENLLSHGTHPLPILAMISRQFRLIWQAKALSNKNTPKNEIAKRIGAHPFFVGEYISQTKNFSQEDLVYVFERLLEADIEIKSAGRPRLSIESLIMDLCLRK